MLSFITSCSHYCTHYRAYILASLLCDWRELCLALWCSVDVTRKVLVAEAWCPVSAKPRVHEALREAAHSTSASVSRGLPCTLS